MAYEEQLLPTIKTTIECAFRDLLSHKHLYQSIRLSPDAIDAKANQLHKFAVAQASKPRIGSLGFSSGGTVTPPEQIMASATRVINLPWQPIIPEPRLKHHGIFPGAETNEIRAVEFKLPTIRTTCAGICKKDEPFNPIRCDLPTTHGFHFTYSPSEQDFVLQYQCQACKGQPTTFLVHRSKDKIILCGREPMEIVTVPGQIPKSHHKHYSSAIIAYQSGQHLPAVFMLRVFIEQYWLSIPQVQAVAMKTSRYTGDILGEEYKKLLPEAIKGTLPTLLETYSALSVAIHTAEASESTFNDANRNILKHFEALRTFEIDLTKEQSADAPNTPQ